MTAFTAGLGLAFAAGLGLAVTAGLGFAGEVGLGWPAGAAFELRGPPTVSWSKSPPLGRARSFAGSGGFPGGDGGSS